MLAVGADLERTMQSLFRTTRTTKSCAGVCSSLSCLSIPTTHKGDRVLEQSYNEHHDPPFGERRHLEQPQITQRIVSADGNAGDWEDIRFDPYISTAMQARESEARAAKRPRREETPDEERKMLEEYVLDI